MKTEKEVEEFRKEIEQRLIDVSKLPDPDAAMKYYQGALRTLEWVVTGQDIWAYFWVILSTAPIIRKMIMKYDVITVHWVIVSDSKSLINNTEKTKARIPPITNITFLIMLFLFRNTTICVKN